MTEEAHVPRIRDDGLLVPVHGRDDAVIPLRVVVVKFLGEYVLVYGMPTLVVHACEVTCEVLVTKHGYGLLNLRW